MSETSITETGPQGAAVPKKKNPWTLAVAAVLLCAGLAWSFHSARLALTSEKTDDAYIEGHVHRIGAGVAGTLMEVMVDDNEEVESGQVLAKIDPLEFEIMERKAEAALQQAKAGVLQAEAKAAQARAAGTQADAAIAQARAEIQQGESREDLARTMMTRNNSLSQNNLRAISKADADQSQSDFAAAEAVVAAAKANLTSALAGKEASDAAIKAAEAAIAAARADIDVSQAAVCEAQRQQKLTSITAPTAGRVGNKNAETGSRVQVGQSLCAVVEEGYWIVGNFKETQLEKMQVGQSVDISVDALGGRHFKGRVDSFSSSTGARFALLPPDNATGNFTKVVQRVPVKITFDADSIRGSEDALRPGLSTVVRVMLN
ncbi:HlyD family secretion protein [Luteolibacter yonseiensis]|uniref:HlyD family secretion protein n=1 Tax=Luteolibacter yonseiensis TaxID=1144680 RepID=A0A934VB64_9BACT|nr:HlyD family secretion protein [Luteolibacter yonseiensis]MBK1815601.1 HlyD family secretion protein [Luteolibacter yonseiensis]